MPIKKAGIKSLKQAHKAAAKNRHSKTELKKTVKQVRASIATRGDDIESGLATAIRQLDRAAQKGIIKKNKAGRLKSRLAKAAFRAK